jgi:hypothetical protein
MFDYPKSRKEIFAMPTETEIEVPITFGNAFHGTMSCEVFEMNEPGQFTSTTTIRDTQAWGIDVKWTVLGELVNMISGAYHLHAYLENLGVDVPTGAVDRNLTPPTPVLTTNGSPVPGGMKYEAKFQVPAGSVAVGVYKIATLLQLYRSNGTPCGVAGLAEGPIINIFHYTP